MKKPSNKISNYLKLKKNNKNNKDESHINTKNNEKLN
jgi:hypothetical protein